jgi:gas vesicle protein
MRVTATIAILLLLGTAACSGKQPESSAATANAQALADQLEAKANNYAMQADDTDNSELAVALENASDRLDEQSANLRAEASPNEGEK